MRKSYDIFLRTSFLMLIIFFFTFSVGLIYAQNQLLSAGAAKVNITPKENPVSHLLK